MRVEGSCRGIDGSTYRYIVEVYASLGDLVIEGTVWVDELAAAYPYHAMPDASRDDMARQAAARTWIRHFITTRFGTELEP